ncbi:hypothetical protein NPF69_004588, partial [Salmonella enterica]|nr:hypothetical protein [Salmonella enterica]
MTVENKFKRNVLAASILVGLSLSAASGVAWAESDSSSEMLQLNGKEALPSDTNTESADTEKSNSEDLSPKGGDTTENSSSDGELSAKQQDVPAVQPESSGSLDEGKSDEDKGLIDKIRDGANSVINSVVEAVSGGGASEPEDGKDSGAQTLPGGGEENSQSPTSVSPSDEGDDSNIQSPGGSEAVHANGDGTESDKQPELDGKPVVDDGSEPGKQPELDGKPVVDGGSEPGKQPELDGKPVVDDGSESGKQPELDGKPVVDDGSEPGKQPEL